MLLYENALMTSKLKAVTRETTEFEKQLFYILFTDEAEYFSCTFEPGDECFLMHSKHDHLDWFIKNVRIYT